jgi:hypothetical protein
MRRIALALVARILRRQSNKSDADAVPPPSPEDLDSQRGCLQLRFESFNAGSVQSPIVVHFPRFIRYLFRPRLSRVVHVIDQCAISRVARSARELRNILSSRPPIHLIRGMIDTPPLKASCTIRDCFQTCSS